MHIRVRLQRSLVIKDLALLFGCVKKLMNNKVVFSFVLSLWVSTVSAEEIKTLGAGDAFDYMSCSAFFAVMSHSMTDKPEYGRRFNAMSEIMIDHAISLEDQNYKGNTADDMAIKLMKKMQENEESAKYVIRQYVPHCKELLKKIKR